MAGFVSHLQKAAMDRCTLCGAVLDDEDDIHRPPCCDNVVCLECCEALVADGGYRCRLCIDGGPNDDDDGVLLATCALCCELPGTIDTE